MCWREWFVLIPRYKCNRFFRDISLRAPGRYLTIKSHGISMDIALAISVSISNYSIHQVLLFPHKLTDPPPSLTARYCQENYPEYTSETHSQALTKCSHFEGKVEPQKVPTHSSPIWHYKYSSHNKNLKTIFLLRKQEPA